jgi:hypothetical protein
MVFLGFGGMVGFCTVAYVSSHKKYGIVEPPIQLQPLEVNENQQPEQESPENIDSVQSKTETQADHLVIPNSNDQPKQDSEIQLPQKPLVPKKYGALSPSDIPEVQNSVGISPDEI